MFYCMYHRGWDKYECFIAGIIGDEINMNVFIAGIIGDEINMTVLLQVS